MMDKYFYENVVDIIPMAYGYHRILCDKNGQPYDYKFIEVNPAFETLTGLKASDILNKTVTEVLPDINMGNSSWIQKYGDVALNGTRISFDEYSAPLEKWYRVFAYSPKKNDFVTLFFDVTDLVKSREKAHAIQTGLNDIIFEVDKEFRFESVVTADETKLFMPDQAFIGKTINEFFPAELASQFMKTLKQAKESGTRETILYPSILPSQNEWYQAVVKHTEFLDQSKYIISISDVTKQKAIEKALSESEKIFRIVFEQVPIGIAICSGNRYISNINPMFEKITGRSAEELKSLFWMDITHPDDMAKDSAYFEKFKTGEINGYSLIKRYIRPDGSHIWVNMKVAPLNFGGEGSKRYLCIIEDITEYLSATQALEESERSKTVFLSHLPGMAYRCKNDKDRTMQFISDGCYALTGYKPESLLDNKEISFNQVIDAECRNMVKNKWDCALESRAIFKYEYKIKTAEGNTKWVLEQGQGIFNTDGEVEAIEGIIIDITESKLRETEIQYVNEHDLLTGLFNRQFYDKEKIRLNSESYLPVSIIVGDINDLRLINDAFGHAEGDDLLIKTARVLKSLCREEDIPARIGGDDFRILMPNTDNQTALAIVNKIADACKSYNLTLNEAKYKINLTFGYGTRNHLEDSLEKVEKTAEENMFTHKLLNKKSSHSAILSSIMATMFARSQETEGHARRLAEFSRMIGEKLLLSRSQLDELELFAMLHDIGKVGIEDRILNKPGKLNAEEWATMKKHPEIGYRIAMSSPDFEPIATYILCHHERWDGKGYPRGLKEEEIPLLSRILAVADAYDAMTENRVYQKAIPRKAALHEIKRNAGKQFDPGIVQVFLENINEYEKNSCFHGD